MPWAVRDWMARALGFVAGGCGVGMLATIFVAPSAIDLPTEVALPAAAFLAFSALGAMSLGERLELPRQRAVAEAADAFLRGDLTEVERELVEYLRFYSTPEWRTARDAVIRRDGAVCRECARPVAGFDLAVDHVKPRSRFPELALALDNLQVLCRRCNSAKGASVS